uniref:Uncharacterized protein n=1 Tax=Arundo donax TaxID=35708 RepID=A0A0A8Z2F6_ARUDO
MDNMSQCLKPEPTSISLQYKCYDWMIHCTVYLKF